MGDFALLACDESDAAIIVSFCCSLHPQADHCDSALAMFWRRHPGKPTKGEPLRGLLAATSVLVLTFSHADTGEGDSPREAKATLYC